MPTYGTPRKVEIILTDDDGTKRVATATKLWGNSNQPHWDMRLQHPSGTIWPADYGGGNILDALGEIHRPQRAGLLRLTVSRA
jgi:hypothetical protein